MREVLDQVAKKEKFTIPDETAEEIIEDCQGNMRKALLVLEALKMQSCVEYQLSSLVFLANIALLFSPDLNSVNIQVAKPDWETYCYKVADLIMAEQTPNRVLDVRAKLYELLSHCIPPTVIIKVCRDPFSRSLHIQADVF